MTATVTDRNETSFTFESPCEHVHGVAAAIIEDDPFNAHDDVERQKKSRLREKLRAALKGCYPRRPVPLVVSKTMQLAAGLSPLKDIVIELFAGAPKASASTAANQERG